MKRIIGGVISCMISIAAACQNRIAAEISNFSNNKGICRACLFNSPSSFEGEGGEPFKCVAITLKNQTAEAVFDVPAGTYAMFVFHDENSNNKLDRNFLGIPKEGYGASKNKLPFAAAPTYNENKFAVEDKVTLRLKVKIRNL